MSIYKKIAEATGRIPEEAAIPLTKKAKEDKKAALDKAKAIALSVVKALNLRDSTRIDTFYRGRGKPVYWSIYHSQGGVTIRGRFNGKGLEAEFVLNTYKLTQDAYDAVGKLAERGSDGYLSVKFSGASAKELKANIISSAPLVKKIFKVTREGNDSKFSEKSIDREEQVILDFIKSLK